MRRAALVPAGLFCGLCALIGASVAGGFLSSPQIAFAGADGALYSYDVDRGLTARMLYDADGLLVAWGWSPDGSRFAYVLLDPVTGLYNVHAWQPELRQSLRIAGDLPFGAPPQWSPDSAAIAAVNAQQDICLFSVVGGPADCLGVQPAGQPAWSPDGAAIAYVSRLPAGGLLRVDIADKAVTPLFGGVDGVSDPRWSPDGSVIAFAYQADRFGQRHLYLVPGSGGAARALTGGDTWQNWPVWSPDGAYLAYNDHPERTSGEPDIAVMRIETGEVIHVSPHPLVDTDPRWSPDGRFLAFVTDRFLSRPRLQLVSAEHLSRDDSLHIAGPWIRMYAFAWRP